MGENAYNLLCCDYSLEQTEKHVTSMVNDKYSPQHVQKILQALNLAKCLHSKQVRCNGASYVIHPMRVALMLLEFDKNTISKVFTAALLHDTLEKTDVTFTEIEEVFGMYVAKLVQSVTRKHDECQSSQEKTEAKYQNWLEIISGSHEVRLIKACEDLDNMICWKSIPESSPCCNKFPRWLTEAQKMSLPLSKITNSKLHHVMRQEYDYYVEHGFAYSRVAL